MYVFQVKYGLGVGGGVKILKSKVVPALEFLTTNAAWIASLSIKDLYTI